MNVEPDVGFAKQGPPLCAEDPEGTGGGNPKPALVTVGQWSRGKMGKGNLVSCLGLTEYVPCGLLLDS